MAIRTRKKQSTTRLWLLVALLVVVLAVIFMLPSGEQTEPAAEPTTEEEDVAATTLIKSGAMAPDFTVTLFDGSTVTLSDLKGKVVLLTFWATWCPPCRAELKRVQTDLIDRFADREFVFLPISRGEQRDAVAAFREQNGYTFAMGLDPDRAIYDRFASNYIPRNFLIDASGRVVSTTVGYEPEEFDALLETIDRLAQPRTNN